jgi:hypothetical protein
MGVLAWVIAELPCVQTVACLHKRKGMMCVCVCVLGGVTAELQLVQPNAEKNID